MERVGRARAVVGVRFRLHGRDPFYGLDCVGVIAWACRIEDAPTGYGLGSVEADWALKMLALHDIHPLDGRAMPNRLDLAVSAQACPARPGDILLFRCGARHIHLAVATDAGAVHACAWLRRVVEGPIPPEWQIFAVLRPKPVLNAGGV